VHPVSRRAFLQAGAGLAGAAALAACSGGGNSKAQTLTNDPVNGFGIAVGTAQALSGVDQRIVVGLFEKGKTVTGDRQVRLSFAPDVLHTTFAPSQIATFHGDGIPTKAYYEVVHRFDQPGPWFVKAEMAGGKVTATKFDVVDPALSRVPVPGRPMPKVASPTTVNAMGVSPLCTRQPAQCGFHQMSIDAALATGKPTAVLFATPALCESRTCGPVLEVLSASAPGYAGKVQIIHVEVWTDLQAQTHVPAFTAYGLDFEPMLFVADGRGVVRVRLDGPYDTADLRAALNSVVTS
jgi:hypothetical protein